MSAPQIVVVGSYATGLTMKVRRLPSSGETLMGHGYRVDFGGKGSNQTVGCARLGAQVQFVCQIGNDRFGDMAFALYREEGIGVVHAKRSASVPTGVGFIVVEQESGRNCIVIDPGANALLSPADVAEAETAMRSATVVLTQLEMPVAAAASAMERGRANGAITVLNPAPACALPASVLSSVDVLTPNESEAKVLAGYAADAPVEPQVVAQKLIGSGVKHVVITLGEQGALLVNTDSQTHFPAVKVQAIDTTGAGDAFNAGLAVALSHGSSLEKAVEFGTVTGAMAVTKEGVIPSLPRREEVLTFLRDHEMAAPEWLGSIAAPDPRTDNTQSI
ncbi:MAG TPA: ribokinase [Candidatus Binatia bacterium]|nr:ribokinase [Candidatus Binatia bacterium]